MECDKCMIGLILLNLLALVALVALIIKKSQWYKYEYKNLFLFIFFINLINVLFY
jgi:hypothetical protein